MEAIRILALMVVASTLYGFAHDLVTARVCAEYFQGHPPLHDAASAVVSTTGMKSAWFFGLVLGFPVAYLATTGERTPLRAALLAPAIGAALVKVALVSALAGSGAYTLVEQGGASVPPAFAARLAPGQHAPFLAAYWAHRAACVAGVTASALVCLWTWKRRDKLTRLVDHRAR